MPLIRFLLTAFFALLCITQAFLAPPAYADHDGRTAGICARTAAVHNAIVASIAGVTDCALVTTAQLAVIRFLSVSNSGITTLKAGDFAGLSALTTLDLGDNQISTLPAGVFSGLSALTRLDLVDNPLDASTIMLLAGLPTTVTAITNASGGICARTKEVRDEIVRNINEVTSCASVTTAHLAAITSLVLRGAGIITLKAGDFAGLFALTRLDLGDNQISTLPADAFSDLFALTRLDLGDNQISTLPADAFSDLFALTRLDLGDNQISTLPAGVFSGLSALTRLDLVGNPLDASAITLLAGLPATVTAITNASGGICARTKAIRDEIVRNINGGTNCASVTTAHLAAITSLGLRGITTLKVGDFAGLSALTRLDLNDNQISTLPADAFSDLSALTRLFLGGNQISTLPAGVFSGLSKLTRLFLGGNQISTLPAGVFSGLSKLTTLVLGDNQISTLPADAFSDLSALTTLVLNDNQISTLPAGIFSNLSALTRLVLNDNQISTLPAGGFSGLSKLTRLVLNDNQISTLPAGVFSGLSALTRLDMVGNPLDESAIMLLTGLPTTVTAITNASGGICTRTKAIRNEIVNSIDGVTNCALVTAEQLAAITFLGLGGRGITTLKAGDFAGLSALTTLVLNDNQISTLPAGAFSSLSKLTFLGLSDNQISTLPAGAFSSLSKLTFLGLSDNQISTLPADAFSDLSALTRLDLGDNPLDASAIMLLAGLPATVTAITNASGGICTRTKAIRDEIVRNINRVTNCASVTMAHLAAITSLDLRGITTLKVGDFAGLSALTRLDLGDNQISTLPADAFSGLSKLTTLVLNDNQISTLPAGIFSDLSALTRLDLVGNPLDASAITLLAGLPATVTAITNASGGICARTKEVRNAIVASIAGVTDCALVTTAHLAAITSLGLRGITTLKVGDFAGLSALTALNLGDNQISTLPAGIFSGLSALISLDLNDNQISTLPAGIFSDLSALIRLDLSANQINALPADIFSGLSKLMGLGLNDNQINALPADIFSDLSKLIGLFLSDNQISTLPAGIFSDLSALTRLSLNDNQISALSAGTFSGLSALTILTLYDNQISTLPAGIFSKLSALTGLGLHNNQISTLPAGIFSDLSALTELVLNDNQISTLPAGIFSKLSALTELDVVGNPLDASAIMLLAGLPATVTAITNASGGICARTKAVRDEIVRNINGVTNCASVTAEQLAAITSLGLRGITTLKAGDFAGLSALTRLDVVGNPLDASVITLLAGLPATVTISVSPVVEAGQPQTVAKGTVVTLDGSASFCYRCSRPTYTWIQTTGVDVPLTGDNTISPTFTAPDNLMMDARLTFSLTVTDARGLVSAAATDTVTITVTVDADRVNALAKISAYAADDSNPAPTLMDYTAAGVMDVSADNLEAVNATVAAASTAAEADTMVDIQALVALAIDQAMVKADDTGLSPTDAKQLNEAVLPQLIQSTLASTMSAAGSRMDATFSGTSQAASYQLDGQMVQLNGADNLKDAMMNKLPYYVKSLKDGNMDWKAMLARSSFVMPLNAVGGDGAGATVWGSGDYNKMSGKLSDGDWKGDVFSLQLGVDQRVRKDLLAGGLVSWSKGDIDYAQENKSGDYTHQITSVHPYLAWTNGDISSWGSVGYGQGKLAIKQQEDSNRSSDTRLLSLSAGVSGRLMQYGQSDLSLKSDMTLAQVDIAGSADDRIPADKLASQRLRLLLEVDKEYRLASGGRFNPLVEVGLRYDGGVGDSSGIGAVLGLGGRYANTGLTVEGKFHTLVGRKDYKEWGVQGTIRKTASANERGLSFSLSPSYGATGNSANQVWQRELSDGNNRNNDYRAQLDVNMGYGLFTGGGLLTPYSELSMSKNNRYRLGLRWKPNSPFDLHLYGERETSNDSGRILLESHIRF